ncbi:MAG: hypothetical protein P8126_10190 [Gammaproteobacteria bacterium]|jgi:hypothetical protein
MEAIIEILPVTAARTFKVWWAYIWRSLLILAAAFIIMIPISFLVGLVTSLVLSKAGLEPESLQLILRLSGSLLGFTAGLLSSIIPFRLILNRDFYEFRLALITFRPADVSPESGQGAAQVQE